MSPSSFSLPLAGYGLSYFTAFLFLRLASTCKFLSGQILFHLKYHTWTDGVRKAVSEGRA
jgi:hypothetical protein